LQQISVEQKSKEQGGGEEREEEGKGERKEIEIRRRQKNFEDQNIRCKQHIVDGN